MHFQRAGTHRLASLGAAQVHDMTTAALLAKIMIEAHDAVNFRDRQIQLPRDQGNGVVRHESEFRLHRVQDRHQRAWFGLSMRANLTHRLHIGARHHFCQGRFFHVFDVAHGGACAADILRPLRRQCRAMRAVFAAWFSSSVLVIER
jgi:hypothetical protein